MPWIDSLDWSSLNALRRYPLREGCSALSIDENFTIPDDLVVDFTLCATSDVTARFYISKIVNKITSVVIEVSDFNEVILGTFEVVAATHTENKDYYPNTTTAYLGANGKITIGSLASLNYQPAGSFTFRPSATEFEPRTIVPGLQGIDRIYFSDYLNKQATLTGSVTLVTRNNMTFSYKSDKVYLDAGDNLGLNKECVTGRCIKSINGVTPDPLTGDVGLLGVNCLKVSSTSQYTLDLEDTCCTPCSGCNDLEELTGRLTSLENKFLSLRENYNAVNSQLTNYLSTINSNCACPA